MKSCNFKFINYFKYLMLIPIVFATFAIIFGLIFGVNVDYEYKQVSTFNVKFATTVEESEYRLLEDELHNIVKSSGINDYRIERTGENASNGLIVKIVNDGALDDTIETLKTTVEDKLVSNITEGITSKIYVNTGDTIVNEPLSVGKLLGFSALALGCILAFVFVYTFIRYDLMSAISLVLTILLEIAMLTSLMVAVRIPYTHNFVLSYAMMIILTIIMATYINNQLKDTLNNEKFAKSSNSDRVYYVVKKSYLPILIIASMLIISLIAVMIFSSVSIIYLTLSMISAIFIAVFAVILFNYPLWSFWYKRDKDIMLKRRVAREKAKEEKKSDEKIVV